MSESASESSRNDSIRTLAIFFAATAVGLLSYVEAVYAKREDSSTGRISDDVVALFLLLSTLFSLSVAGLRRPQGNTRITDFVLRLSFITLIIGTVIFLWCNLRKAVSVCFTVVLALLAFGYVLWTDPAENGEDRLSDRIMGYRKKWNSLGQPPRPPE